MLKYQVDQSNTTDPSCRKEAQFARTLSAGLRAVFSSLVSCREAPCIKPSAILYQPHLEAAD